MKVSKSSSGILSSGGNVIASDLTVDGSTVTVDESNNRLGVNTDEPLGTLGIDGDLFFQPVSGGITTSHVYTNGSLDIRCTDNMKIGTDGADSVRIGRTNTTAAKVHISSGTESDLVVSNSMVGIGTDTPTQALELDGNIQLSPSAISTAHIFTTGSLDVRASANIKIGTDGADSVKIGRTNSGLVKCHIRSGGENDLVVSNSMVGIGTDSPDHTLSVDGDIDLTGALSFDGSAVAITEIDTDISSVAGTDTTLATAKAIKTYVDSVATGDITEVTAGNGLTGGGASGAVSLAVGAGTGIDVAADAISVDVSDFLTNGSDNRIVTATGTDAMNAESSLTFDGNTLTVTDTVTDTNAGTYKAIDLNFTKTGASTSNNTMIGLDLSMSNTSATDGTNSMIGAKIAPTCQHAADAGSVTVKGVEIIATGGTPGTETARALDIIATGADYNQGIYSKVADGGPDLKMVSSADVGDYCTIGVAANGATTITTVDDDGANADLSFSIDGSFDVTAATSVSFAADTTVTGDITATGGDLTLGTSADSADTSIKAADESGTDTAGKKLSIQGGLGTGNAAPGAVEISVGVPGGASGTSVQSASLAIKATAEGPSTYYGGTANLANDSGVGEIVIFGTEDGTDTLAAGRLMVLNSSGVWKYADADAEATTSNLLAIALGTAVSDGLLVKGYFKLNSYIEGSFAKGAPCYVSEAAGEVDFTRPSAAGDFVRVLGM